MSLSQFGQKRKKQAVRRLSAGSAKRPQWGRGGFKRDARGPPQGAQYPTREPPSYHDTFGEGGDSENLEQFAGFSGRDLGANEQATKLSPRKTLFQRPAEPRRQLPQDSYEEGIQPDDLSSLETFGEMSPPKRERAVRASPERKSKGNLFAQALAGVARSTGVTDRKELERDKPLSRTESDRNETEKDTVPGEKGFVRKEELNTKISLRLRGIPNVLNTGAFLRSYYSKFGSLKRVYTNPKNASAIVTFYDHISAAKAKSHGKLLKKGTRPIDIFWSQSPTRRRSTASDKDDSSDKNVNVVTTQPRPEETAKPARVVTATSTAGALSKSNEKRTLFPDSKPVLATPVTEVSSGTSSLTGIKADLSSLSHLIGKVAVTAAEKYEVLEERDKILRQHRKKTSNIKNVKATTGSCPDMCPEKERYMRQYRRHLSCFEIIPGTDNKAAGFSDPHVEHSKAIKEYSRSSADQELPLPHELRPAPVLTMTMNYLLHHIMDKGEDRLAEWYDFLWNRTRGIRKDITQQNLTDVTAVALLEKCSRFHIYCAHRLCEEEMGVFDPKINDENLTKCLQSLEHFYFDLNNENVHCHTEAEFRAYDILLNLNEGDILRKVQLYREEVRESTDVRQAVAAFNAVNSNNFVRFFKIVREAKYLNACIMHRYFTQVRSRALSIMNRAYRSPVPSFPLHDFIRILGFEDALEATHFCVKHGLTVAEDTIHFDRAGFIKPEDSLLAARSLVIIEEKKFGSVAEVVNGEPLCPFEQPTPVCSFDAMDRFVGDASVSLPAMMPTAGGHVHVSPAPQPHVVVPTPTPTAVFNNEIVKDITRELFIEVINEFAQEVSSMYVHMAQVLLSSSHDAAVTVTNEVTQRMTQEVVEETIMVEIQKEENERIAAELAAEKEASKQTAIQEIGDEILENVLREELDYVAEMKMREIKETLNQESLMRSTERATDELVTSFVDTECECITHEVIRESIEMRDEKLAEIEKMVQLMILSRFFKKWKNEYIGRQRLKRDMLTFPSAPKSLTASEQVEILSPWQQAVQRPISSSCMSLNKRARLSIESPVSIEANRIQMSHRMILHHYKNLLKQQKAWLPLDLPQILARELPGHSKHRTRQYFWKIVLSLPEQEGCHDRDVLVEWIENKLTRGKPQEESNRKIKTLSLYTSEVDRIEKTAVSICTKSVQGAVLNFDRQHTLGVLGLILALPPLPEMQYEQEYWTASHARLRSLLENKPPDPAIPLLVLLLDWPATSSVQYRCVQGLQLERYKENRLISVYSIVLICGDVVDPSTGQEFSDCIRWLGKFLPAQPTLTASPLQDYIESGILQYFTTPLLQETFEKKDYYQNNQNPNRYIQMYNQVLEHLASVITSDKLQNISWPVPEFTTLHHEPELPRTGWNSCETLDRLKQHLRSCHLPSLPPLPMTAQWADVWKYTFSFLEQLSKPESQENSALLSRVKWLLNRAYDEYQYSDLLAEPSPAAEISPWKYMPWNLIIEACVGHVISKVTEAFSDKTSRSEVVWVYYYQDLLRKYSPPVLPLVTMSDVADQNEVEEIETLPSTTLPQEVRFDESARQRSMLHSRCESPQFEETMISMQDLEQRMLQEKQQLNSYDEQLRKWLEGETYEPTPVTPSVRHQLEHDEQEDSDRWRLSGGSIMERLQELESQLSRSKRDEEIMEMNLTSLTNY